jgi:AcrR family transcriptional regulator
LPGRPGAICQRADITVRYFYESFTDKDAFVAAVLDWVVADVAATTQAAVAAAPIVEQTRAGLTNIVAIIPPTPGSGG